VTQFGPVEVLVVAFPGSNFNGAIAPALQNVVERGDITVVDLAFITKAADESVSIVELSDISDDAIGALDAAMEDILGLLSEDDLLSIGEALDPGSSAVAIVIEHRWARELAAAVAGSDGQIVINERIPRDVVAAAVAAAE
jgi:hypothetical protein